MKEIRHIINAYQSAVQQGKKAVLATVVHIEGSAYRAPGARMLVREDGQLMGAVSGGCLEGDVLRKALLVMSENKPALVTYDTSDENAPGLGASLGCNGVIRILLEPVEMQNEPSPISLLELVTQKRQPALVVIFFIPGERKNEQQGTKFVFNKDGIHGNVDDLPVAYHRLEADLQQAWEMHSSAWIQYEGRTGETDCTVFFEFVEPSPALVIAGAGNDVMPVANMAALLGWEVTLIDGRPAYANESRFPSCQLMVTGPENALASFVIDRHTAVLLMSHNYQYDKSILAQAIHTPASYIGILGPVKKRDRLLHELNQEGKIITAEQEKRIYGPTGLDIGAETSEEIALSILSEVKTVFSQRQATSLRNYEGAIHNRRTSVVDPLEAYGILLLAAGSSKRMGTPKQQLIYQGDTLLKHAVRNAVEVGAGATVVVIGTDMETTARGLNGLAVEMVVNEESHEGMGSSIRKGVAYIQQQHLSIKYILIMLCDQPFADAKHLRTLIHQQQLTGAPATASFYAGRKGVPALFEQSLFGLLQQLEGDTGAKHIIEQLGDQAASVSFPEGVMDIDTAEMYQQVAGAKK